MAGFPSVRELCSAARVENSRGEGPSHVARILSEFRENYGQHSVSVCDPAGGIVATGGGSPPGAAALDAAREAARSGKAGASLVRDPDGFVGFVVAVPVAGESAAEPARGAVLLVEDARSGIFDLLWRPVPGSSSSEVVLAREEGDAALVLSPLLFRPDSPLTFRIPLERTNLPARRALDGEDSFGSFVDYRGTPVFAAIRRLKSAPWGLVVKVDEMEALASFRKEVRGRAIALGLALVALIAAAVGLWRSLAASSELRLAKSEARYGALLQEASGRAQESELYFRSLIENGFDLTAVLSVNGRMRYSSPSIERILGYKPEALADHSVFEFIHEDDRQRAAERLREAVTEGIHEAIEVRFRHKDGSWRTLSAIGNGVPAGTGMTGLIINARDVTERLKLESQFRQAQKMEAIGRLAGGVAHDFNNLLTVIQGYGELVRDSLAGDPRQEGMIEVLKASTRAAALTQQLLAFSRKQHLEPKILPLADAVRETGQMLERLIGEDVTLTFVTTEEFANVKADPSQIEQVLLNLAVNARDAMPVGGRLTISVDVVTLREVLVGFPEDVPAGRWVRLTVEDTGTGMEKETLLQAFEPFFTTKERGKGTGLGLSTVYGIVRQSDGHVQVTTAVGEGTSFRVYFPPSARPSSSGVHPKAVTRPGTETVLLVEDEPAVRNLVRAVLEKQGYVVLVAEDGPRALALLDEHAGPVHVLLTDVVMPGMTGRELAASVLSRRPGTKVLFMSGYTADISTELEVEDGTPFLAKPFRESALTAKLREVLDSPAV